MTKALLQTASRALYEELAIPEIRPVDEKSQTVAGSRVHPEYFRRRSALLDVEMGWGGLTLVSKPGM